MTTTVSNDTGDAALSSSNANALGASEIRRIREKLGLSRAEAGALLGGGPRAFTKYEKGDIAPAAAVSNLLRLLDAQPGALPLLTGKKAPPIDLPDVGPLRVTGEHIAALSDRKLVALTQRLISAEAQSSQLPLDRLHVGGILTASDEGEDGRIEWTGGPEQTPFLPSRSCLFQLKATTVTPAVAAADVRNSAGEIEAPIREMLQKGGSYIVLCARMLTMKQIRTRQNSIREVLEASGLRVSEHQIQFRDASQIAEWTNSHPAARAWVLQQTQPGLIGPFRDWNHWAGQFEHERSPFVADERLTEYSRDLRAEVSEEKKVVRVEGVTGVGKARLTLEALAPQDARGVTDISDLVLYAAEPDSNAQEIKQAVQTLVDASRRAIVVVDCCPPDLHVDLAALVKRSESRLSLVTLDFEPLRGKASCDRKFSIGQASSAVIENILKGRGSSLEGEDFRRLMKFSSGNPLMAILVSDAWAKGDAISNAPESTLVEGIVLGRATTNRELLLEAASLLSAFGLSGFKQPLQEDLDALATFSSSRSPAELRIAFESLIEKGVVQVRGRLITMQLQPIAMALAERQWRGWNPAQWDAVLSGNVPENLRTAAARRLSVLNFDPSSDTRAIAQEVAEHVCRRNGPLDSLEKLSREGACDVMAELAEGHAESVMSLLERITSGSTTIELQQISSDVRRRMCWALAKIVFLAELFESAALMLLRLAVAESERWQNNSTGLFLSLFHVLGGATTADAKARLRLIDEALRASDLRQLEILVDALLRGADLESSMRDVGAEKHGSRPALEPWRPKTWGEVWDYVHECLRRLTSLAERMDEIGGRSRAGLGHGMRSLVNRGHIDWAEQLVEQITKTHAYWPAALNSLNDFLQYDAAKAPEETIHRARKLVEKLTPTNQADRVRFLVSEMPWDFPEDQDLSFEEKSQRQFEAVRDLVAELLGSPESLPSFFNQLSRGEQRKAFEFGKCLAELSPEPLRWKEQIVAAAEAAPEGQPNFSLLTGYFAALSKREPGAVDHFKSIACKSPFLAKALPLVCWAMDISPSDIRLVCMSLDEKLIEPWHLGQWACGGVLAKLSTNDVAPLFDQLITMDAAGFVHAVDLLGMYSFQRRSVLEGLRPQLKALAAATPAEKGARYSRGIEAHHFEEVIGWLLAKGPTDPDARDVAVTLAKSLVTHVEYDSASLLKPLLKVLLSSFADVVWPIVGAGIVADQGLRWQFEHALGDRYSFSNEKKPAILILKEDILFGWCHANPEVAPAFVAAIAPTLASAEASADHREIHPLVMRLLNDFGERTDVLRAVSRNLHTFSWSGSLQNYWSMYEKPLRDLEAHPKIEVRQWARAELKAVISSKAAAKTEEDEREASWDV